MNNNYIKVFFDRITSQYGRFSRLYKVFQTNKIKYMYDVGTGKVCQCSECEYDFLNELLQSESLDVAIDKNVSKYGDMFIDEISNLIEGIKTHHLLCAEKLKKFERKEKVVLEKAETNLQQITLELTECCNLACRYCIYGEENSDFREFGNRIMSWKVAKAAVDYALAHSKRKIAITFYGGEPLLNFELLKQIVEYTLENKGDKECTFSMTTNLTLLSKEIALYLSTIPQFSVVGSIDGNKEVHNQNRVDKNGKGSYDAAILGLKNIVEAFGERAKENIILSMVIDTPINDERLENIQDFFEQLTWFPKEIVKRISYVRPPSKREIARVKQLKEAYSEPIGEWSLKKQLEDGERVLFTNDFLEKGLLSIHNRILAKTPIQKYQLNGCCYPGSRRLYVSVDGNFSICERIGKAPILGNVFEGIKKEELLNEYHRKYIENSIGQCAECWAINLCEICFMECYDQMGFDLEKKNIACGRMKRSIERNLKAYFSILEDRPEIIEKLNTISVN